jgi:hypothetical protein
MLFKFRHRISYANVASTLALTLALGGSAYAAISLPNNSVGTKQLKKDAVISSKVKNGSLLAQDFKSGQLPRGPKGDTGPQGPKGDTGPRGPKGDAGPGIRWALVKSDGTVLLQSGGITAVRAGKGVYYVHFDSAVTGHAISATLHSAVSNAATVTGAIPCSGNLLAGTDSIVCPSPYNTVGNVQVGTDGLSGGSPSDQDFYIEVFN